MPDFDIAADMVDAIKNDKRINDAFTEWLNERYLVELSDDVRVSGLQLALRVMLSEARERAERRDARVDRIERLITEVIESREASAKEHAKAIAEIRAQMSASAKEHADRMARMDARTAAIEADTAKFAESMREFRVRAAKHDAEIEAFHERFAVTDARLEEMHKLIKRANDRVNVVWGDDIERVMVRNMRRISKAFDRATGKIAYVQIGSVFPGVSERLGDARMEAVLGKVITDDEDEDLYAVDAVFVCTSGRSDDELWVVGEASSTIDYGDISRARDRAATLRKIGFNAGAFVFGYFIPDGICKAADEIGVKPIIVGMPGGE